MSIEGIATDRALDRAEQATGHPRPSDAALVEAIVAEVIDYRRADVSLKQELRKYIEHIERIDTERATSFDVITEVTRGLNKLLNAQPKLRATRWPLRPEDSVSFHLPDKHGHGRRISMVWGEAGKTVRLVADGNYPIASLRVSQNTLEIGLKERP